MMRDYFTFRDLIIFLCFSFCGASVNIPVIVSLFTELRDHIQTQHTR